MTSVALLRSGFCIVVGSAGLLLATGCGGTSSGSGSGSSPVQPAVIVTVAGPSTTQIGTTGQFTATVVNTTNTAVTWQVNGTAGGNATVGTISGTGLYTAPMVLPATTGISITAVSQASPTVSATATDNLFGASMATSARLLDQASFGPTANTIQHVQTVGVSGYLSEQFAQPTTLLAGIPTNPLPALCLANNSAYPCAESEWWPSQAMTNSGSALLSRCLKCLLFRHSPSRDNRFLPSTTL